MADPLLTTNYSFRRLPDLPVNPFAIRSSEWNTLVDNLDQKLFALLGPSTIGSFGEMFITGNATITARAVQNTWYKITPNWQSGLVIAVTQTPAAGTVTIQNSGIYRLLCVLSFGSDGTYSGEEFGVFKNGVLLPDNVAYAWSDGGSYTYKTQVTISGLVQLAAGDVLDLRTRNIDNPTTNIIVSDVNFNIYLFHS
jgi:hypothetical protein